MTGIEHYREAERLIDDPEFAAAGDPALALQYLAEAQVHATLALAAAVALKTPSRSRWGKVAGHQEKAAGAA